MVSTITSSSQLKTLEDAIEPLRAKLATHPVYGAIRTVQHLRLFMESHIYAVWDFMSLLKCLQKTLTCVDVPWTPSKYAASRRFVNEIVLGEESDDFQGRIVSHFELYIEAMRDVRADVHPIEGLVQAVRNRKSWESMLDLAPLHAQIFVRSTFDVIENGSAAAQAAAFTFGREDVIPDMFRNMVKSLNGEVRTSTFSWYLERHIEVDGDEHGPLSRRMVEDLCGDSSGLWVEATTAAEDALRARLALWDGVVASLK